MAIHNHSYAIYPGSVTLQDGSIRVLTAEELATLYGVQDEPYLVVDSPLDVPQGKAYFDYIHLKPRQDNVYQDWKAYALVNGEEVAWGPDFDGDRQYTQETDRKKLQNDID